MVNYGNNRFTKPDRFNKNTQLFGCAWDNETWLALNLSRAIDYLNDDYMGRLIGFKFIKDINLILCDENLNTILPKLEKHY